MTTLVVPALDQEPWPSLGAQVCAFIEEYLIHGPGDLRGQPARLDDEKRGLIYRIYEVYPQGHPFAGRRRFRRVAISLRKGSAKTEFAAWIGAVELHPDGPVRCRDWDGHGEPIGDGIMDPYIPMVAYTEQQTEDLAYGALRAILAEGPLERDFDIGLERILRKDGRGKCVALASSPNARDGARTTFEHFDETHRFTLPQLKAAHRTMLANLPKRQIADPWALETTTAPSPGEGSVAEDTMEYARAVEEGRSTDARLFFFHRQASDVHDLKTKEGIRAAVIEASGPVAAWSDIEGIVEQWDDPTADLEYLEQVWLNRLTKRGAAAFNVEQWKAQAAPCVVPDGETITLGFDGSRYHDSTGIVATHVRTGYQWVIGAWERPVNLRPEVYWEVPRDEVDVAMDEAFNRWTVFRLYADPPDWESEIAGWSGIYGHERVLVWWTREQLKMGKALRAFGTALGASEITNDGHPALTSHIGASCRKLTNLRDDKGERYWTIIKDKPDSTHKIDLAIAAVISWAARCDALALGIPLAPARSIYEDKRLLVI